MAIHLILGGARSGKSAFAERLARDSGLPVKVIATAEALDDEMTLRIRRHQLDRPTGWDTIEQPTRLADALHQHAHPGVFVIVDCLTLWLGNLMAGAEHLPAPADADALPDLHEQRGALLAQLPRIQGEVALVANEVGLGLVPETPLGRLFRDEAGRLNQQVAALADRVTFVAAGLPLTLKPG